jgi:hypothetical protein
LVLFPFKLDKTCRYSATKARLANAVFLFILPCLACRLWKTTLFRKGYHVVRCIWNITLLYGMAQCKVYRKLTTYLWTHMCVMTSVSTYLRQLLFVSFVELDGHRSTTNLPKKMLSCSNFLVAREMQSYRLLSGRLISGGKKFICFLCSPDLTAHNTWLW